MSLTTLLGVAISLSFAYLLLSTIASTVNELVVGITKTRAKDLRGAIEALVGAGGQAFATSLAKNVYDHALVAGTAKSGLPAYVPSRNFTLALLDTVLGAQQQPTLTGVQTAIATMPPGPVRQALTSLLDNAGGDLAAFKTSIDRWYDDAMDRLGGAYKRRAQWTLFAIGLLLAAFLNVDTVRMVRVLMRDPVQLEASVKAATAYIDSVATAEDKTRQQDAAGPATGTTQQETAATTDTVAQLKDIRQRLLDEIGTLTASPLPIGWETCVETAKPKVDCTKAVTLENVRHLRTPILPMIAGWLLTAIAVSFGGPFWFDLINQFINLRSSGPKPADPRRQTS
ncbi:MAG TPA: hypothetical protein VNX29_17025 [Kaistia sp.]|nr:hypothetical protein [Kaistia sp.]